MSSTIPSLSIDNVIFGLKNGALSVLLVRHGEGISKGSWGLPGGWVDYDEDLDGAAERILNDLTGVEKIYLDQLRAFGDVHRYPGKRVITIAYYALIRADEYRLDPGSTATDARWWPLNNLPSLIYDHRTILDYGIATLRMNVCREPVIFKLLPEKFTLLQLQALYEAILDKSLDKSNFRRKMQSSDILTASEERQEGVAHRAAKLYSFNEARFFSAKKTSISLPSF